MRAESLHEVIHAAPFRPFDLMLADGTRVHVPHPEYIQWPDTELELQGFLTYPLVMASHSTDCTGTWRSAGCLTNGRRIPISLCGNSTSSTVLVRPVGG